MRILTLAAIAACAAVRLCATEYYIDYVGGADTNQGTSVESAWKHCPGDAAAGGRAAAGHLSPGDVVHFKGGVTYLLSSGAGIALRWDGATEAPIVYDGNSSGRWGEGRARFSDGNGGSGVSAFVADGLRRNLVFTTMEFAAIGGASGLPGDTGSAVPPRFGGGLAFPAGLRGVTVEHCVFRELGYWFNGRPMSSNSIAGAGISAGSSDGLRIDDCAFSRVARGIDLSAAAGLNDINVTRCTFGEAILWPFDLPQQAGVASGLSVTESTIAADLAFDRTAWTGYGEAPRTATASVQSDTNVTFTVSALGGSATFQWFKNGVPLAGATQSTLRLDHVSNSDGGTYTAIASNGSGSSVSNPAVLVVTGGKPSGNGSSGGRGNVEPSFTQHPASQVVTQSEAVTLSVAVSGTPAPALQWYLNQLPLAGATSSTLAISSTTTADAGEYLVVATNAGGSATSRVATLSVLVPPAPRPEPPTESPNPAPPPTTSGTPVILATNLLSLGAEPARVDFTVEGNTPRQVLVRAVGPSLAEFRLVGTMSDPRLEVEQHGVRLGENDNWGGNAALRAAMGASMVFPLVDGASRDAALLLTVPPGQSSVVVRGNNGSGGLVWVDVYLLP